MQQIARLSPVLFISRCSSCDAISFSESELEALNLDHHCLPVIDKIVTSHLGRNQIANIESAIGFMNAEYNFPDPSRWN